MIRQTVLFDGRDASGYGLWVTNGTRAGTYELTGISGANASGLFLQTLQALQYSTVRCCSTAGMRAANATCG